ncbi:hypothetical protein SGLAM104S_06413 [Streptomyces glaucescens]
MIAVNSACRNATETRVEGDHLGLALSVDLRQLRGAGGHGGGPVGEGSGRGHGVALLSGRGSGYRSIVPAASRRVVSRCSRSWDSLGSDRRPSCHTWG